MNAIPISKETLKDLYGPSFFLLEGELAQLSEVQEDIAEVEKPIAEIETKAPASETPRVAPVQEEKSVVSNAKPGIEWKVKPTSKVLFIISASEWSNKELLELLKKIVASLGIPFELAGFGLISGPVQAEEFQKMPQKYGVVFDDKLLPFTSNPMTFGGNEAFFSHKLDDLKDSKEKKMALWGYLQQLKEKING